MKKRHISQIISYVLATALIAGMTAGCGSSAADSSSGKLFHSSLVKEQDAADETEAEADTDDGAELYLVVECDQLGESLRLYRYSNGMEYRYYYGIGTRFYDKYGGSTTVSSFTEGTLVTIGTVNADGILREAQVSDQAWTYGNVSKFTINEDKKLFKIANSRYTYDDDETYVFSDGERVGISDISKGDTLSVAGLGKEILSVVITTGQGTLALSNTSLFEGSFMQLGDKFFTEITEDMELSVEEGTYTLTVANNGWGGSAEVEIVRGQTTEVDLDEIKGDGPKMSTIQFIIDVADAVLMLDDTEVDYSSPIEVSYGTHTLAVYANGYDAWLRNLYVNSESATVIIQLNDEDGDEDEATIEITDDEDSGDDSDSDDEDAEDTGDENDDEDSGSGEDESEDESEDEDDLTEDEELDLIEDILTSALY
ncbi:MAG: hypothetical protein LUI02_03615 [Clostridiales bacterium]|nr:hypothetical protein [Clostridiales bacterium]